MKLSELTVRLLQTHAQCLERLAAWLGEETLLNLLENTDPIETFQLDLDPQWVTKHSVEAFRSSEEGAQAYRQIQGAVEELKLPAVLEFYLWAYPFYRLIIESSLDLNLNLQGTRSDDPGTVLTRQALAASEQWVKTLPLDPSQVQQASRIVEVPWLRFRAEVLKRLGHRPLGVVE